MKTKKQTDYYKVVNVSEDDNSIEMLDYIFNHGKMHGKPFKGATGTSFEPVSKEYYRDALKKDNIIEHIIDSGLIEYKHNKDIEYKMAEVLYKEMKAAGELERFMFDLSYMEHWDELRKEGFPKSKYPIFNCTGGGRIFDKEYKGNRNPELIKLIQKAES